MTKDKRKYADRAEYLKSAVDKRRKEIKQLSLEYKGNKCSICGYNKCILLCANCHREVHEGITQLPQVIEVEKRGELLEA